MRVKSFNLDPHGLNREKEIAMLVLSRQRDESIMLGDDIMITIVDIRGDKVRLGIKAPREISVHRKEVYDAIRRENRAAAQSGDVVTGEGAIGLLPQ